MANPDRLLDAPIETVVNLVLPKFGRQGTYRTFTEGTVDPTEGERTGASETERTVNVILMNGKRSTFPRNLIQMGDQTALVARSSLSALPKSGVDELDLQEGAATVTWSVIESSPVASGARDALYELLLRR